MKKKIKTTPYDFANYLKTEEEITEFLKLAIKENDPNYLPRALGIVARARGMSKVAKKAGMSRQGLYSALDGTGSPELATILKVIGALGLKLTIAKA